jgi:hypothetical protein
MRNPRKGKLPKGFDPNLKLTSYLVALLRYREEINAVDGNDRDPVLPNLFLPTPDIVPWLRARK